MADTSQVIYIAVPGAVALAGFGALGYLFKQRSSARKPPANKSN